MNTTQRKGEAEINVFDGEGIVQRTLLQKRSASLYSSHTPPAWSSVSRDSCFIFYNDNDSGNDDNNDSNILFLIYATFSYEPSKFKILRIWLNDGLKD